jgi:hypothetical protein
MKNKLIAGSVVAVATLATAGAAAAGTLGGGSAQAGGEAASKALASNGAKTAAAFACDGGHQKRVYNRIVNSPVVLGETAGFVRVPGAGLVFAGPAVGRDTLSVTFSAETQLRGNAADDKFDWSELEVRLDGVPMQPAGGPGDPMALTGSPYYAMNAAQFCGRVGRGVHSITVWQKIVDNGTSEALSVWLDDYLLRVEQSE